MTIKRIILSLFLFFISSVSFAFVEKSAHGYFACITCHVSPSGGGLLNDYGRSLSRELMSTWGWEGSEQPFWGATQNTDWLKIGGDSRIIQTYLEDKTVRQGKLFKMQNNLELGFVFQKFTLVSTFGTIEGPEGTPHIGEFISERHYFLWESSDDSRLRAGKFRPQFGLNDPNHTRVTKLNLGFGSNSETYNMEFLKFGDDWEVFLTSVMGRIDLPQNSNSERAFTTSLSMQLKNQSKIGASYWIGESSLKRRSLVGLYGVVPFFSEGVFKFELDHQRSSNSSTPDQSQDLVAGFISVGANIFKGFMPYVFTEHLQTNLNDKGSVQTYPGLGIQWLPMPHLELQSEYKRQINQSDTSTQADIAWLLFHLYY